MRKTLLNWFKSTEVIKQGGNIIQRRRNPGAGDELHVVNPMCWYENRLLRRTPQYGGQSDQADSRYWVQQFIVGPGRKRTYEILKPLWESVREELKEILSERFLILSMICKNFQLTWNPWESV
jgi:hypothetical protein